MFVSCLKQNYAFHLSLLLPVFCEKTERVLQYLVRLTKFRVFFFKFAYSLMLVTKTEYDAEHIFLRAIQKGKPEYTTYSLNGTERKAVRIDKHLYIPET